jgi:hypothetical protein
MRQQRFKRSAEVKNMTAICNAGFQPASLVIAPTSGQLEAGVTKRKNVLSNLSNFNLTRMGVSFARLVLNDDSND